MLTTEEFKTIWAREASNQPGMMLEVLKMGDYNFVEKSAG